MTERPRPRLSRPPEVRSVGPFADLAPEPMKFPHGEVFRGPILSCGANSSSGRCSARSDLGVPASSTFSRDDLVHNREGLRTTNEIAVQILAYDTSVVLLGRARCVEEDSKVRVRFCGGASYTKTARTVPRRLKEGSK